MKFIGGIIKEQGVNFGIILVEPHVLNSTSQCNEMQGFGRQVFGPIPIILMTQDFNGTPTYYGRKDIVDFLANILPEQIPLREYTID